MLYLIKSQALIHIVLKGETSTSISQQYYSKVSKIIVFFLISDDNVSLQGQ